MNTQRTTLRLPMSLAAAAVSLWLSGCDRDLPKVGERGDDTVQTAEASTGEAIDATAARVNQMADQLAVKIDDATITAGIHAELAKDPALRALKIHVDTEAGHVRLRGMAPDRDVRNRAASLAAGVKGVVGIDNQLQLQVNS